LGKINKNFRSECHTIGTAVEKHLFFILFFIEKDLNITGMESAGLRLSEDNQVLAGTFTAF